VLHPGYVLPGRGLTQVSHGQTRLMSTTVPRTALIPFATGRDSSGTLSFAAYSPER